MRTSVRRCRSKCAVNIAFWLNRVQVLLGAPTGSGSCSSRLPTASHPSSPRLLRPVRFADPDGARCLCIGPVRYPRGSHRESAPTGPDWCNPFRRAADCAPRSRQQNPAACSTPAVYRTDWVVMEFRWRHAEHHDAGLNRLHPHVQGMQQWWRRQSPGLHGAKVLQTGHLDGRLRPGQRVVPAERSGT